MCIWAKDGKEKVVVATLHNTRGSTKAWNCWLRFSVCIYDCLIRHRHHIGLVWSLSSSSGYLHVERTRKERNNKLTSNVVPCYMQILRWLARIKYDPRIFVTICNTTKARRRQLEDAAPFVISGWYRNLVVAASPIQWPRIVRPPQASCAAPIRNSQLLATCWFPILNTFPTIPTAERTTEPTSLF